jgi:hypothetical protein
MPRCRSVAFAALGVVIVVAVLLAVSEQPFIPLSTSLGTRVVTALSPQKVDASRVEQTVVATGRPKYEHQAISPPPRAPPPEPPPPAAQPQPIKTATAQVPILLSALRVSDDQAVPRGLVTVLVDAVGSPVYNESRPSIVVYAIDGKGTPPMPLLPDM